MDVDPSYYQAKASQVYADYCQKCDKRDECPTGHAVLLSGEYEAADPDLFLKNKDTIVLGEMLATILYDQFGELAKLLPDEFINRLRGVCILAAYIGWRNNELQRADSETAQADPPDIQAEEEVAHGSE